MSTHIASPRTATFGGGEGNQSVGQQFELMDLHPPVQCRCHTESVFMLHTEQQNEMCLYATICMSLAMEKGKT